MFDEFNDFDGTASIAALTLKDGMNYEDAGYDEIAAAQVQYNHINQVNQLPTGFAAEDDLDGDGKIDGVERAIKVYAIEDKIHHEIEDQVKEDYLRIFRKEVDFHHKVAYRFEKAYRLGKKMSVKKAALNAEIMQIISEHSSYLD